MCILRKLSTRLRQKRTSILLLTMRACWTRSWNCLSAFGSPLIARLPDWNCWWILTRKWNRLWMNRNLYICGLTSIIFGTSLSNSSQSFSSASFWNCLCQQLLTFKSRSHFLSSSLDLSRVPLGLWLLWANFGRQYRIDWGPCGEQHLPIATVRCPR